MPQRRKRITALQRIAKTNPQVNKRVVEDTLDLIDSVRKMGFKGRSYELLGISESRLKVELPVLCKL